MTSKCGTCLVYHIDEGLRIVPREATDGITLIFTRKNRINQGGEFIRGELASDQTATGCGVEVRKEEP